MIEPFVLRALLAGLGLGLLAAPLGCLVVWRRMSYFGSTIAHSGLLGVALGLMFSLDLTVSVLLVALAIAMLLIVLQRQKLLPMDSLLGLLSHASLAAGIIAAAKLSGQRLDLMGYLFGDIYSVSWGDLTWIYVGAGLVLLVTAGFWRTLVALSVHEELAAAEGFNTRGAEAVFIVTLAVTIAIAMKIVGILLIIAFLIMPAAAARPFATTPETMVGFASLIAFAGVAGGLALSYQLDLPGGPSIVMVLALLSAVSLMKSVLVREG